MADCEFSRQFIARVQAGRDPDVEGWRVSNSAQGLYLSDQQGQRSWELLPDEPAKAGHIAARQHRPRTSGP